MKRKMHSIIHFQTSTPLKFGNGYWSIPHSLQGKWLFIHTGNKLNHVIDRGPYPCCMRWSFFRNLFQIWSMQITQIEHVALSSSSSFLCWLSLKMNDTLMKHTITFCSWQSLLLASEIIDSFKQTGYCFPAIEQGFSKWKEGSHTKRLFMRAKAFLGYRHKK